MYISPAAGWRPVRGKPRLWPRLWPLHGAVDEAGAEDKGRDDVYIFDLLLEGVVKKKGKCGLLKDKPAREEPTFTSV